MKTIVVISDTHGNFEAIDKILPVINESDYLIHLGDYQRDILAYRSEIKPILYSVKGNCDCGSEEEVIEIENVKILITHGHRYDVKNSTYKLYLRAKELNVDVVFYGHTHIPQIEKINGIYLVNPGCMTKYSEKSYCYAVVHNGKLTVKINKNII